MTKKISVCIAVLLALISSQALAAGITISNKTCQAANSAAPYAYLINVTGIIGKTPAVNPYCTLIGNPGKYPADQVPGYLTCRVYVPNPAPPSPVSYVVYMNATNPVTGSSMSDGITVTCK
jgi:hypothetical protein